MRLSLKKCKFLFEKWLIYFVLQKYLVQIFLFFSYLIGTLSWIWAWVVWKLAPFRGEALRFPHWPATQRHKRRRGARSARRRSHHMTMLDIVVDVGECWGLGLKTEGLRDCDTRRFGFCQIRILLIQRPNSWSLTAGYSRLWQRVVVTARKSWTKNLATESCFKVIKTIL